MTLESIFGIIGGIIGLFSIAVAIFFDIRNRAQIKNVISKLHETTQEVEAIANHLSFSAIKPFPFGLDNVINLLKKYQKIAKEKHKKFYLDIYTDVPGYAVFSHNKLWNDFYDCLKNIVEELKTNFPIYWYFYSDSRLKKQIREQFASWKEYNLKDLKKEIYLRIRDESKEGKEKEILKFMHDEENCRFCTSGHCRSSNNIEECKEILELKNEVDKLQNNTTTKEDISHFVEEKIFNTMETLHTNAIERIKYLSSLGNVRYANKRLDDDLPFFAWIILEESDNSDIKEGEKNPKLIPVEGIVSYNFNDEQNQAIEKGFKTSDHKLISSLYDIVHSNAKQQLKKSKQQSQQKEG